jgi:hypothetical protein
MSRQLLSTCTVCDDDVIQELQYARFRMLFWCGEWRRLWPRHVPGHIAERTHNKRTYRIRDIYRYPLHVSTSCRLGLAINLIYRARGRVRARSGNVWTRTPSVHPFMIIQHGESARVHIKAFTITQSAANLQIRICRSEDLLQICRSRSVDLRIY